MKKSDATIQDIKTFLETVENKTRRADADTLLEIFERVTGQPPKFWPPSIIGFGEYHYKYESGREGDSVNVGFSPRKAKLVMYVMGKVGADHPLMAQLGKYKTGSACLYVNKLADIDLAVLEKIIKISYDGTVKKYGSTPPK